MPVQLGKTRFTKVDRKTVECGSCVALVRRNIFSMKEHAVWHAINGAWGDRPNPSIKADLEVTVWESSDALGHFNASLERNPK